MSQTQERIHLGTIIAAHGIKGEVKVKSFAEIPEAIAAYGSLQDEDGKTIALKVKGGKGDVVVAIIKGVTTRNQAEDLATAKTKLYVSKDKLRGAQMADGADSDGAFLVEDLKGLKAFDAQGQQAIVQNVVNFGAGDILVLKGAAGEFMLPFKPPFAENVDLAKGTITIFIPEGWLETPKKKNRNADE